MDPGAVTVSSSEILAIRDQRLRFPCYACRNYEIHVTMDIHTRSIDIRASMNFSMESATWVTK